MPPVRVVSLLVAICGRRRHVRALLRAVMYVVAIVAAADTYLIGSKYLADSRGMPIDQAQVTAGIVAALIALVLATVPIAIYQQTMRRLIARRRAAALAEMMPRPEPVRVAPDEEFDAEPPPPPVRLPAFGTYRLPEPPLPVVPQGVSEPEADPEPAVVAAERSVVESARRLVEVERAFGAQDAQTFAARRDLASAYWGTGQLELATQMYESILADCEGALGEEHQETLVCRSDLAAAYEMDGRLDEAISLYAQTLAIREEVLGTQHPDTLSSRSNLTVAYSVRDNLSRGRRDDRPGE
jgi:hypothetical protein